jgi:uncharacterized protein YjdB
MKQIKICIAAIAMLFGIVATVSAQRGYHDAPYTRYEANQGSGGQVVESTDQNNIAFEASERKVVYVSNGNSVEWTNVVRFRGIVVRAAGANSQTGYSGQNVSAKVYINNTEVATLSFDPNKGWKNLQADGNQNYNGISNGNPRMRYDEQRYLHSASVPSGATIKIVSQGNLYLDFIEIEDVADAIAQPAGYARYNGNGSDLETFINNNTNVYIPAGTYTVGGNIEFGGNNGARNIQGAGMWYTTINFTNGNGGIENGGFLSYNRGSTLKDVALTRTTGYSRSNSYKGLNGVWGIIERVWVERFECGAWFGNYNGGWGDSHADGMVVTHCRFRNNYADGVNLCQGTRNSTVSHCSFRNNGDDDMAIWPASDLSRGTCYSNTYEYNTAEHCWFASSCALYGGRDNKYQYIVVKDNWEVGIRSNSNFSGYGFESGNIMSNIDVIRCGTNYNAYSGGYAAIDLQGNSNIRLECIDVKESLGNVWHNSSSATLCGVTNAPNNGSCNCSKATIDNVTITNCPGSAVTAGNTVSLGVTVTKTGDISTAVNWTSSSDAIASVNSSGVFTTKTHGSVTITATSTADPTKKATCTITVTPVAPQNVQITASKTPLGIGEKSTFTAKVNPDGAIQTVTWSSSSDAIATVNPTTGEVTGIAAGDVVITATSTADASKKATVNVKVEDIKVSSITLVNQTVSIGGTITLTPNVQPANATNKNVDWSSNDNTTATVNAQGVVTGVKAGSVTITATAQDGSRVIGTATVNVVACTPVGGTWDLVVDEVTWTSAYVGAEILFTATIRNQGGTATPNGKHGVSFTISSQDEQTYYTTTWNDKHTTSIPTCGTVTLTATGGAGELNFWKPEAAGTYKVVAYVNDDSSLLGENRDNNKTTANVMVTAAPPVTVSSITIAANTQTITEGQQVTFSVQSILPENAANKNVTYSIVGGTGSGNLNATTGVLTNTTEGTIQVQATAEDASGVKSNTVIITVNSATIPVIGVTITNKPIDVLCVVGNNTVQLGVTVTPENATNKNVIWTSDRPEIIKVSDTGLVTVVTPGQATITATSVADGTKKDECFISVMELPNQPDPIIGETTVCANTTQTYSVGIGAESYTWTVPNGWTITSGQDTNEITVTTGANSGNITVKANSDCGSSAERTLSVTANKTPEKPSNITGNSTPVKGATGINYSITNIAGVTYTWSVPNGWTITSGQGSNQIAVIVGNNSGNITVTPSNDCGNGTISNQFAVNPVDEIIPVTNITIAANNTTVTEGEQVTFSVESIEPANATNQNVTYEMIGGNQYGTLTGNILSTTGVGTIRVQATAEDASGVKSNVIQIEVEAKIINPYECEGEFDLELVDITWEPQYPQIGEAVTFTATIKNIGAEASPNAKHGVSFAVYTNYGIDGEEWHYATTWHDLRDPEKGFANASIYGCETITLTAIAGGDNGTWTATEDNHIGGNGIYQVRAWVADNNTGAVAEAEAAAGTYANNQLIKTFEVGATVGIPEIEADGKSIIAYNNTVEIRGVEVGEVISVYNLLGMKIYSKKAGQNPEYITSLREGLYTVVIEGTKTVQKVMILK